MFKNKNIDGTSNLIGPNMRRMRKRKKLSQNGLAIKLQLEDLDLNKNAIQQIEAGKRFVTDIELKVIAGFFGVSCDELLDRGGRN